MSEPITVATRTADRIAEYLQQQEKLQMLIQSTITTLAESLDIPAGWQYDPGQRAFVAPPAPPVQREDAGSGQ